MGRSIKWPQGYKTTSYQEYFAHIEIYDMARELAYLDDISFSELILKSLSEYVETHYPGNPQLALTSFNESGLKPIRLEAKFLAAEISKGLKTIGNIKKSKGKYYFPGKPHRGLVKNLIRLARLNRKIKSEEYDDLVDRGERELE